MLRLSVIVGFVLVSANAIQDGVEGTVGIAGLSDAVVVGELGQPLRLRCKAYGYPPPSIYWYRGRKGPMVPFSNVQYEARDNVLHIKKLSIDTLGEYVCLTYIGFRKPVAWSITVKAYRIDDFDDSLFLVTRQNEVVTTPRQPQTETTTTVAPEIEVLVYTDYWWGKTDDRETSITENEFTTTESTESDISSTTESTTDNGASIITEDLGISDRLDTSSTGDYWWGKTDDSETSITENEFTTTETTENDISSTTESTTDNGASIITEDLGISDRLDTSSTADYWWGETDDRETSITENEFTTTETTENDISSTTESTTDNGASIITEDLGISDRLDTSSTADYWWGETDDRETSITENEFTTTETTENDISSTTESTTDNGASIITEDLGISDRLDTSSTGDYWWGKTDDSETSITENEFTTTETTENDISSTTESTTDNGASIITEDLGISDRLDTSSTADYWWGETDDRETSITENEFTTTETTENDISSTTESTTDNGASIITEDLGISDRLDTSSTGDYWWGKTDDSETSITENEFTTTETTENDISSTTESTTDNGASIITEDLGISDRLDTSSTADYWWGETDDRETSITENEFTTTETTENDISSTTESTTDNGASIITEHLGISDRLDTSSTGDYWWGETDDRETSITENEFTTTETTENDISSTTESTTDNGASIITEDLGISDRLDTSSTADYWWGETDDRETSITENEFTTTETTENDISSTTESTTDNGASIITEHLGISDRLDTSSTGGSTDSTTAESSTNYSFESSTTESDETGTTRYTETTEIRESSKYPVPVTTHIVSERTLLAPGSELSLLCEVDGYPLPQVSWFKDFALISSDDRITVAETHLTVSRANRNDTGVYSCHAFNALNSHYSSVQINVERLLLPPTCEDYPYMSNCNLIVRSKICYNKLFSNFCCKSCVEARQLDAWGLNAAVGRRHA